MVEFLNSYTGLPEELLSAVQAAASESRSTPSCGTDTSDCSSDGYCSADSWDCSTDHSCSPDTCSLDGVCSSDGMCRTDSCSSDGVCSDTPAVVKPSASGSLTVTDTTSTSITIRMSSIARAEYYEIAYRRPSDSTANYEISYSLTHTITGLDPNTTYVINYRGVNSGGDGPFMSSAVTARTKTAASAFNWTYAGLGSAGSPVSGNTKLAGYGIYVTADEWNELAGLVASVTGNSVTVVLSGTTISESIVNTMARALGVGTVSRGDAITASFFNALRSAYNALL